jgi:hypothetical protein
LRQASNPDARRSHNESLAYAEQPADVLREAGWTVGQVMRTSLNDFPGYVVIATSDDGDNNARGILETALNAAEISVRVQGVEPNSMGAGQANSIHLIVGRKSP